MTFSNYISLGFLFLLVPLIWAWKNSLVDQDFSKKSLSLGLRVIGIILLIISLCRPFLKHETDDLHIVYLVDSSQSIDPLAMEQAHQWINTANQSKGSRDTSDIYLFASTVRHTTIDNLNEHIEQIKVGTTDNDFRSASPIAEALLSMRSVFPANKAKKLIILSDAKNTGAKSTNALKVLKQEKIDVVFKPLDSLKKPEAAIVSLTTSTQFSYQGEMIRFNASLLSNTTQQIEARLLHKGIVVAKDQVSLNANELQKIYFDTEMHTSGMNHWSLEITAEKDFFTTNNKVTTSIKVKGLPRFLVLHEDEKQMRPFARSMKKQGIEVEIRGEYGMSEHFDELLTFDGIILANISATNFTGEQMTNVSRYVTEFGGGILMLGSDNSYGLGGYFKTPIEEVLPLTSRYEKEKQKPSLAMVLVIDKSGSMSGMPIAMARASALATAELLSPNDQIAVIGFDGAPKLICPLTSASDQATIQSAISSLEASGGTHLYPAMVDGRDILQNAVAKIKHMIILSDGQTQEADFINLTQEMANEQMTVSTVALGSGAAKGLMQRIAAEGMGRYYETDDPEKMLQIFTKETMKASRSSIKEDLFNSIVVGDHPLLNGYENMELPFILGYVMTRPKPTAQILLAAETGDPLFAISRYGLGRGAAYTSDLTEKWGGEWLASSSGGPFWAQALRSIARKEESAGLSAHIEEIGELLKINVSRVNERGETIEQVPWALKATDEQGNDIIFELQQTGLGEYSGFIDTIGKKQLHIRLHDELSDLSKSVSWHRPYSAEYRLSPDQDNSLTSLPIADSTSLFNSSSQATIYSNASWIFVFLGFIFFISGLAVRRL